MVLFSGRNTLSRRDALLLLVGATCMHLFSTLFPLTPTSESIVINTHLEHHVKPQVDLEPLPGPPDKPVRRPAQAVFNAEPQPEAVTKTVLSSPTQFDYESASSLPHTSIVHHAPGWTLFRNLYMSNGTIFILASDSEKARFPEFRLMSSTGLKAEAGNEAAREPTEWNMAFVSPEEAKTRWGPRSGKDGEGNRVMRIDGSTALFNDPPQFLNHYYHLVAELFFGFQAFWHGAWAKPLSYYTSSEFLSSSSPAAQDHSAFVVQDNEKGYADWNTYDPAYNPHSHWNAVPLSPDDYLPSESIQDPKHPSLSSIQHPQSHLRTHPRSPPLDRAIFINSPKDEWRDRPGFNAFFLRSAFPSLTLETSEDWADRVRATSQATSKRGADLDRAYVFPVAVLVDRSASFRGLMCGSRSQRTAAEAWEYMRGRGLLRGERVGGWWEEVRERMWRTVGVSVPSESALPVLQSHVKKSKAADVKALSTLTQNLELPRPENVVVTYLSRQVAPRRKLTPEAHQSLVKALEETCERRGWEFVLMEAETMTKDEQVRLAGRTTILISPHGNGLTHLLWMPPTAYSTVVEIFFPGGFAHDYHWTSRALGMKHFGVWGDKVFTHPNEPQVDYPEGFQENYIPVDGPTVARLVEDRVDGKV